MGNTTSSRCVSPQTQNSVIPYEIQLQTIIAKHNWIKCDTYMDSFCEFYYDPAKKYVWVVQQIGSQTPLITRPSESHVRMIVKQYGIVVAFAEQPSVYSDVAL